MVEAMACLGGRAERRTLAVATALPTARWTGRWRLPSTRACWCSSPVDTRRWRFRHDRIREAVLGRVDAERRRALQLAMARRMASVPGCSAVAAEHVPPGGRLHRRPRRAASGRGAAAAGVRAGRVDGRLRTGQLAAVGRAAADRLPTIGARSSKCAEAPLRPLQPRAARGGRRRVPQDHRPAPGDEAVGDQGAGEEPHLPKPFRRRRPSSVSTAPRVRHHGAAPQQLLRARSTTTSRPSTGGCSDSEAEDDLARPDITDPAMIAAAANCPTRIDAAVYLNGDHTLLGWLSLVSLRIWITTRTGPHAGRPRMPLRAHRDRVAGRLRRRLHALRRLLTVSEARWLPSPTPRKRCTSSTRPHDSGSSRSRTSFPMYSEHERA